MLTTSLAFTVSTLGWLTGLTVTGLGLCLGLLEELSLLVLVVVSSVGSSFVATVCGSGFRPRSLAPPYGVTAFHRVGWRRDRRFQAET